MGNRTNISVTKAPLLEMKCTWFDHLSITCESVYWMCLQHLPNTKAPEFLHERFCHTSMTLKTVIATHTLSQVCQNIRLSKCIFFLTPPPFGRKRFARTTPQLNLRSDALCIFRRNSDQSCRAENNVHFFCDMFERQIKRVNC